MNPSPENIATGFRLKEIAPLSLKTDVGRQWGGVSPPVPVLIAGSLILALAILVFDLSTPLSVAAGAPYVLLVLIGYFFPWRYCIYFMAGLATLLTIIGYYLSPVIGEVTWIVLTNRSLTLVAIWATAVIGMYIKKKEAEFRTERIHAIEQLNKLSSAIEQSPVSIIITDINGNIEYVNPKFIQVSGYDYAEVIGRNPRIFKSSETPPEEYKKLWETITAGDQWRGMFHNAKKNGELYWEAATISPIRNNNGEITHFLAVKEDVTEQLETENQLTHALKIEATGRLASGIAHDFNNLLTIIAGNLQLLAGELGRNGNDEINEIIADAMSACADSGQLVNRLLALSHKEKPRIHNEIDINKAVVDMTRFLDRILGEDIKVKIDLEDDIGVIVADYSQFESTLLNLAANSRDAMADGGIFTVKTARITVKPDHHPGVKALKPGNYTTLTVSDTGTGMNREVLQHACEPFFTTKAMGKGSGLGLNMVQNFIKHSGGCLDITSAPGAGTSIILSFPEAVPGANGRKTETGTAPAAAGAETILVVEDMDQLRHFAVHNLTSLGYQVLEAADADAAMEILRKDIPIDLLFTDIVIPGDMDGRKLAEWATGIRSGLKAALVTGRHPDNNDITPGVRFALLKKPYSVEQLADFIRSQLDKK